MIVTRRVHLVVVATACTALVGFGFEPAALAEGPAAGSVTVQATPSSVPESGGEIELLAIVRDDRGRPLENAKVNFLATTGTLVSGWTVGCNRSERWRHRPANADRRRTGRGGGGQLPTGGGGRRRRRGSADGERWRPNPGERRRQASDTMPGGWWWPSMMSPQAGSRTDSGTSATAPRAPARARLTPSLSRGSTRSHCAARTRWGSDEVTRLVWVGRLRGADE